jgi:hypothetical protein
LGIIAALFKQYKIVELIDTLLLRSCGTGEMDTEHSFFKGREELKLMIAEMFLLT